MKYVYSLSKIVTNINHIEVVISILTLEVTVAIKSSNNSVLY